jgi:FeS assembly protein IscX
MPKPLYWDSVYEIAQALGARFPDIDLDQVSLMDIFKWTIQLPGFDDFPELANDEILLAIFQEWYEERNPL